MRKTLSGTCLRGTPKLAFKELNHVLVNHADPLRVARCSDKSALLFNFSRFAHAEFPAYRSFALVQVAQAPRASGTPEASQFPSGDNDLLTPKPVRDVGEERQTVIRADVDLSAGAFALAEGCRMVWAVLEESFAPGMNTRPSGTSVPSSSTANSVRARGTQPRPFRGAPQNFRVRPSA